MNLLDILSDKIGLLKIKMAISKLSQEDKIDFLKKLLNDFYEFHDSLPQSFYMFLLGKLKNNDISFLKKKNIYEVIDDYRKCPIYVNGLEYYVTPEQYIIIPIHFIKKLRELLLIKLKDEPLNRLDNLYISELIYKLSRQAHFLEIECIYLAYKLYLSIGFNYSIELLENKYGNISFKSLYYLFIDMDLKEVKFDGDRPILNYTFLEFLFKNKAIVYLLKGEAKELYLNFSYFYNNFLCFSKLLNNKMTLKKVRELLSDRFLSANPFYPEVSRDIINDMRLSYKNRCSDSTDNDIYSHNFNFYQDKLLNNYWASIPMLCIDNYEFTVCTLAKSDPKNLVMGYRTNNCFRLNGEAAILFGKAMQSVHFRVISISSKRDNDIAMMIIARNGNVLISQGIEISRSYQDYNNRKKIYETCKLFMKKLMEKMNDNGDEIVATIIGCSNENVSDFNNDILPFRISPILNDDFLNYYDGFHFYQCLLYIKKGSKLSDVKLFLPFKKYFDERGEILYITASDYSYLYNLVNKRLFAISVRANKQQQRIRSQLEHTLKEIYCGDDWYIILFEDGFIEGTYLDNDFRAKEEYEYYLNKIKEENRVKKN